MNKLITHFFIIISFSIIFFLLFHFQSQQTITFFPIDKEHFFEEKETDLAVTETDSHNYELNWNTFSKTNKPLYLRQDVSLLYQNGKVKGAKSKWENEVNSLEMKHDGIYGRDALWEAISYHHGEVHRGDQSIKSIHSITKDVLYISNSTSGEVACFKNPHNKVEETIKEKYDKNTQMELLNHWHTLLNHFNITLKDYNYFPLTEIDKFSHTPLPNLTQEETNKILGQLWEGLYENYIMTIINSKPNSLNSYIPMILLDKKNEHLIVLYELNSKKEMLIQKISK